MAILDRRRLPQAERVVRNFTRLVPTLEAFARALTGKDIPVTLGASTFTDGRSIFIMPPFALGNDDEHQRTLCDKRTEDELPACPACRVREEVLSFIYHEISHLAFGSFEDVPPAAFARRVAAAPMPEAIRLQIADKINLHARKMSSPDLRGVSAKVSRFMPGLLNAFEDIRVDGQMVKARPGTAIMARAQKRSMITQGFTRMDGSILRWSEMDLNSQLVIAMLMKSTGIDASAGFHEYVNAVIDQADIQEIIKGSSTSASVLDAAGVAVEALVCAQKYGFFISDNPDENYTEDESDDEAEEESSDGGDDAGADGEGEGLRERGDGGEDSGAADGDASEEDGAGGGGDSEEPSRSCDRDRDSGHGDVDAPDAEDDGEGADAAEPADADGESDGEGGGAPGDDGGDEADADASGAPMGGSGETGGEPAEGGDSLDGTGEGSEASPGEVADGPDAGGAEDRADGSAGEDRGEADAGGGEEASDREADDAAPDLDGLKPDDASFGDHHEVERALKAYIGHDEDLHSTEGTPSSSASESEAIKTAAGYVKNFDSPPTGSVTGIRLIKHEREFPKDRRTATVQSMVTESILGPSLLHMRRAFTDNQRGGIARNKRSGRVSSRVLGRRAWSDDDRLFVKKTMPGKKDYAVLIGVDVSGSTAGATCTLELQAAYAQAELCHRMGIKFAVYAHTGTGGKLVILVVKEFDEPWNTKAIDKLNRLGAMHQNLDGHTLEFYRKRLDEVNATHKILMYYSDGAMPAENFKEELAILKREIATCERKGYVLMAVGAKTNDPKKYRMDTVRIDRPTDVPLVVKHLGRRIEGLS